MNISKKELHGVTILRFIAAFYVFIFHVNMRIPIDISPTLNQSIKNGAIGMSIFFVLSGFILTYNYYGNIKPDYFIRRIARIYPAYLACGLITLPLLYINHKDIISSIVIIFLFLLTIQAWFYQSFYVWNFSGTWSVSVEMFFYALFPFLCRAINNKNLKLVTILTYLSTAILIPVALTIGGKFMSPVYYATPIYRLPEFIFGICMGMIFLKDIKINHFAMIIALVSLGYATTCTNFNSMQVNYITVPSIGVLLIYLAGKNIQKTSLTAPLIYFGNISYSFYLMQLPILYYLDTYKESILRQNGVFSWLMLFLINLTMAALCHKFIECNIQIREFFIKKRRISV